MKSVARLVRLSPIFLLPGILEDFVSLSFVIKFGSLASHQENVGRSDV